MRNKTYAQGWVMGTHLPWWKPYLWPDETWLSFAWDTIKFLLFLSPVFAAIIYLLYYAIRDLVM